MPLAGHGIQSYQYNFLLAYVRNVKKVEITGCFKNGSL